MNSVDIMKWSEPRVLHDGGPPIKNHTMTHHEGLLYCFGGYDGRRNHSTLSIFSIHEQQWYPVQVVDQEEDVEEEEDGSDSDSNASSSINEAHAHGLYRRTRSSSISLLSVSSVDSTNRTPVHPSSFRVCGTPPPGRNGHTATLVRRKVCRERWNPHDETFYLHREDDDLFTEQTCIFIIGGWLGVGPLASADMYILDITNVYEFRWISIDETFGSSPGPCNMHSADFVSSQNEIYIFRGGNGREYLNDLHAFHVETLTWRRVETHGTIPEPRANHSSALIEETNELVIFGGWNGRERLNDIHILDIATSTWSKPLVGGLLPHPRAGMTFTALHGRLFLYGGSGPSSKCFQDLHILDRKEMAWLDVMHVETNRTLSIPSSLNESLPAIVTGGTNRNVTANPSSSSIASMDRGTFGYATVTDSEATTIRDQNNLKVGGGFQRIIEQGDSEDDHGGKKASSGYSGNPNDAENTPTIQVKGKGPGRRAGHSSTAVNRKIYFFGGSCGSEYLNDLYVLDTDPVPQVVVAEPTSLDLLRRRLPFFVNEDDFSDVVFLVEGKRVYSHQLILSLVSDCFRAMFTTGFRESTIEYPEIEIPCISYDSFVAMMEYIYTGQAPKLTTLDHEIDLLSLADQFMLDHLKQVCERMLIPRIDITILGHLLNVSQKCNAPQLEAACRHFERNQGVV